MLCVPWKKILAVRRDKILHLLFLGRIITVFVVPMDKYGICLPYGKCGICFP